MVGRREKNPHSNAFSRQIRTFRIPAGKTSVIQFIKYSLNIKLEAYNI